MNSLVLKIEGFKLPFLQHCETSDLTDIEVVEQNVMCHCLSNPLRVSTFNFHVDVLLFVDEWEEENTTTLDNMRSSCPVSDKD